MSESIIYILAFLVLLIIAFFLFNKPATQKKSSAIKKDELIKEYENKMQEIVLNYQNDKENLQIKKIQYLKIASHELHNNIFFDEHEAKEIIKKLASM